MISFAIRILARGTLYLAIISATVALGASQFSPSIVPKIAATTPIVIPVVPPSSTDNPQVQPGLVRWHSTFDDAKNAAKCSGKPILLFHMMGQMDRQFC